MNATCLHMRTAAQPVFQKSQVYIFICLTILLLYKYINRNCMNVIQVGRSLLFLSHLPSKFNIIYIAILAGKKFYTNAIKCFFSSFAN